MRFAQAVDRCLPVVDDVIPVLDATRHYIILLRCLLVGRVQGRWFRCNKNVFGRFLFGPP